MGRQLNIRDVPERIHTLLERGRHEAMITKREYLVDLLDNVLVRENGSMPLFDTAEMAPRVTPCPGHIPFTYIDLFAGIGGFRIALDRLGGQCLFTSEWDRYSQKTYRAWFSDQVEGDLTKIPPADIPDHDLLVAGFPCQPFSIAGVSKKKSLGRAHGFKDAAQGTLFFTLATIVEQKRPPALLLENVKNLLSHDRGRTWSVIRASLDDLGYTVFSKVIDAADYVPQHRERIFIVGLDRRVFGDSPDFRWPDSPEEARPGLREILDPSPSSKYTLSDRLWDYLRRYAEGHKAKGNGFGFGLANLDGVTRTLSARYYKDGSEILIPQGRGRNPRRLTPRECARIMGFPDELEIVVSDTQAYRQFGNAVCPKVVEPVAGKIIEILCSQVRQRKLGLLKGRC